MSNDYDRTDKLLLSIADDFENAAMPMSPDWISTNDVGMEECMGLSDKIALMIRGWVRAPKEVRLNLIACAAMDDKASAEHAVAVIDRQRAMNRIR